MNCRACNNTKLKNIAPIGKQPLSGIFPKNKKLKLKKYSLDLFLCIKCNLVQLGESASVKEMFGEQYGYQSSISKLMKNHLYKIYLKLKNNKYINDRSTVLDIGSNDGTFLNFFKKTNQLFGIDPTAKKFKKFYKSHIIRFSSFFSFDKIYSKFGKNSYQKFDLVSSLAMFYDVNTPNAFCKDIS